MSCGTVMQSDRQSQIIMWGTSMVPLPVQCIRQTRQSRACWLPQILRDCLVLQLSSCSAERLQGSMWGRLQGCMFVHRCSER